MNIGHRVFVVEGDAVIRISQKSFNNFYLRDTAALPQYAGRTVLVAVVIYELQKRRPTRIIRIDTQRVRVQPDGSIDKEHQFEGLRLAVNRMELVYPSAIRTQVEDTGVVDATALFDERRWKQLHPELSGPAQKKILTALFGAQRAI